MQPDLLALRAFCAFCLTASAVYIINDIIDVEADRAHPRKRHRPIAAGTISIPTALFHPLRARRRGHPAGLGDVAISSS